MATAKDIYVNLDEWNSVNTKLQQTDDAFNDALNTYLAILRTLVYQGIEEGNIHNNLRSLYYSAEELRSSSDEICTKIKEKINALKEIQELDSWDSKRSDRSNFDFTVKTTDAIKHKLQKLEQTCGGKLTLESNKISIADNGLIESALQLTELRIIRDGREDLEALFRKASGKFSTLCNEVEKLDISVSRKLDSLRRELNAMEKKLAALTDYMQMDLSKAGALQNMPTPDTLEKINQCAMKNNSGTCTYDYEEIRAILQKSADEVTYADLLVLQAVLETMITVDKKGNIEPDTENLSKFISAAYVKQGETDVERLEHQYYDGETTDLYYYFHNQAELSPAFRMLAESFLSTQNYTQNENNGYYKITASGAINDLLQNVTDHYSVLEWQDCWKIDIHLHEYEYEQERQKDFYLERFNKACQSQITITHEYEEGTRLSYFEISGTSFQGGDVSLEKQAQLRNQHFTDYVEKFYQSGQSQINYTTKTYHGCANNTQDIGVLAQLEKTDMTIFYKNDIDVMQESLNIGINTVGGYIPILGDFLSAADTIGDIQDLQNEIKEVEENNNAVDKIIQGSKEEYKKQTQGFSDLGFYFNTMTIVKGNNTVSIDRKDYEFKGSAFSESYRNYIEDPQTPVSTVTSINQNNGQLTELELQIYKTVLYMRMEGKVLPTTDTISPLLPENTFPDNISDLNALILEFNTYIDQYTETTGIKLSHELSEVVVDDELQKYQAILEDRKQIIDSVNRDAFKTVLSNIDEIDN